MTSRLHKVIASSIIALTFAAAGCGSDSASVAPPAPPPSPPTPHALAPAPRVAVMDIGVSEPLVVTVFDDGNHVMSGYTATWRSRDPSIASITSDGVLTAVSAGPTMAYVTSAGLADSVAISVTPPLPIGSRYVQVAVKADHACATSDDGNTYCWGNNAGGWVNPTSTQAQYTTPVQVIGVPKLTSLVFGSAFTCGVATGGDLYCWGTIPTDASNARGVRVVAAGMKFTQVAAGSAHACGLIQSGDVYCWGKNGSGQLGTGDTTDATVPTKVAGTFKFVSLTADPDGTCGLATDSTAVCWGKAGMTGARVLTPTSKGPTRFTTLSAAQDGSAVCGTTGSGAAYCWGAPFVFPNGVAVASNGAVGSLGSNPPFTTLQAGDSFACGLSSRFAYCWGIADRGQDGLGTIEERNSATVVPTQVAWGIQYAQIDVGMQSTCAVSVTGRLWCWGANSYGQLGDGRTTDAGAPTGRN